MSPVFDKFEAGDDAKAPLYQLLTEFIVNAINDGDLQPGHFLPSQRKLAEELGIARMTVMRSYEDLISRGFLETIKGQGTCVKRTLVWTRDTGSEKSDRSTGSASHSDKGLSNLKVASVPSKETGTIVLSDYGKRLMGMELSTATSADQPLLHYGAPLAEQLPLYTWRKTLMHSINTCKPEELEPSHEPFGYRPLREAITSFLTRSRGVSCSSDRVIVFSSSQHALDLIARLCFRSGDLIAVENPGFAGARQRLLAEGCQLAPVAVDDEGLVVPDLFKLRGKPQAAYVTPARHDPLGVAMSAKRKVELLEWAQRYQTLIVEDDFDSFYNPISQQRSLQGMDENDCVLYISTLWKVLHPVVTTGFLIVPQRYIEVFARAKSLSERHTSQIENIALTRFLNEGKMERHIKDVRNEYAQKRRTLVFALGEKLGSTAVVERQAGGDHLVVRIKSELDDSAVLDCAQRSALPMVSTAPYYVNGEGPTREFIVPFGWLKQDRIDSIVSKFAGLLTKAQVPT